MVDEYKYKLERKAMEVQLRNIVNTNRHKLNEVVPLHTPYSIFIDVCNACNFRCKFCAIQYSKRQLTFQKECMKWDLYKKVIDDIKQFPEPIKMMRLTANGEPLINPLLPQMIRYAKETGVAEHIEIVTNGSLLSPKLNRELIESGLDRIRISVEAVDRNGYLDISGFNLDWDRFVENITDFYNNRGGCEVYIKTVDAAVDCEQKKEKFISTFGGICDKINIEHIIPIWTDYEEIAEDFRIEDKEGLHGHAIKNVDICPFPFYSCVINPDGAVTACCSDWERKLVMGNVINESIYDIWNGKKWRAFLIDMLRSGRKKAYPNSCAKCQYPCFDAVDDLDTYKESILDRLIQGDIWKEIEGHNWKQ